MLGLGHAERGTSGPKQMRQSRTQAAGRSSEARAGYSTMGTLVLGALCDGWGPTEASAAQTPPQNKGDFATSRTTPVPSTIGEVR